MRHSIWIQPSLSQAWPRPPSDQNMRVRNLEIWLVKSLMAMHMNVLHNTLSANDSELTVWQQYLYMCVRGSYAPIFARGRFSKPMSPLKSLCTAKHVNDNCWFCFFAYLTISSRDSINTLDSFKARSLWSYSFIVTSHNLLATRSRDPR